MSTKRKEYGRRLKAAGDVEELLRAESGLPGPRANLELAQAAADAFDLATYRRWTASGDEYLALCGAIGLGRLAAEGDRSLFVELRRLASDSRWRVREGVAMALQRLGSADFAELLETVEPWVDGTPLEQRALVAGLCEPALLLDRTQVRRVLAVLDRVTRSLAGSSDRRAEGFRVLRLALAYCWSVAAAADPEDARPQLERWMASTDRDVLWVMRQNLTKNRMRKLGTGWLEAWQVKLAASP